MNKKHHRELTLITWSAIIVCWQLIAEAHLVPSVLLPSPINVCTTFINLCLHGYNGIPLLTNLGVTLYRLGLAVILAVVIGVPIGLASGQIPWLFDIVDSIVQFLRPLPPLSYYMLLILWIGIGDGAKVTLLFLAAFAPIYIACVTGSQQVRMEYINSAKSLGASNWQIFWHVILPAALPRIMAGIRTATGVAYTTIVSAEMVASTYGIGWMIINASKYLKSNVMFVGIIILGVTGILLDWGLKSIENHFIFWEGRK